MSSVNKAILLGNLGRDPEVRYTQSGDKIVNMTVATSERWKDRQSGEQKEKTEWHRVVIFDQHIAEVAEKHLKKGSQVYLEGQIQTRKWTDQSGAEKYSTEIVLQRFKSELVLVGGRGDDGGQREQRPAQRTPPTGAPQKPQPSGLDLSDEIPF